MHCRSGWCTRPVAIAKICNTAERPNRQRQALRRLVQRIPGTKMFKHLSDIAFWGALLLSIVNIFASAVGFGPALTWATGMSFWSGITTTLAFVGIGFLIFSWINSFMSNVSGMAIYSVNILLAPFGYEYLGLSYSLGLVIALSPLPLYTGLGWLSQKFQ